MKYKLSVVKGFSAAHALRGYKGKCERLHGHNWKVKVTLVSGKLDKIGMAMDFTDIKAVLDQVLIKFDHCFLNETAPFNKINPTAENIARVIFEGMAKKLPKNVKVYEVEVWESETSSASVSL
jgi:6-pyruvoyltetrahydropterin/6-carboxytetrahydropterin synthase